LHHKERMHEASPCIAAGKTAPPVEGRTPPMTSPGMSLSPDSPRTGNGPDQTCVLDLSHAGLRRIPCTQGPGRVRQATQAEMDRILASLHG